MVNMGIPMGIPIPMGKCMGCSPGMPMYPAAPDPAIMCMRCCGIMPTAPGDGGVAAVGGIAFCGTTDGPEALTCTRFATDGPAEPWWCWGCWWCCCCCWVWEWEC